MGQNWASGHSLPTSALSDWLCHVIHNFYPTSDLLALFVTSSILYTVFLLSGIPYLPNWFLLIAQVFSHKCHLLEHYRKTAALSYLSLSLVYFREIVTVRNFSFLGICYLSPKLVKETWCLKSCQLCSIYWRN